MHHLAHKGQAQSFHPSIHQPSFNLLYPFFLHPPHTHIRTHRCTHTRTHTPATAVGFHLIPLSSCVVTALNSSPRREGDRPHRVFTSGPVDVTATVSCLGSRTCWGIEKYSRHISVVKDNMVPVKWMNKWSGNRCFGKCLELWEASSFSSLRNPTFMYTDWILVAFCVQLHTKPNKNRKWILQ